MDGGRGRSDLAAFAYLAVPVLTSQFSIMIPHAPPAKRPPLSSIASLASRIPRLPTSAGAAGYRLIVRRKDDRVLGITTGGPVVALRPVPSPRGTRGVPWPLRGTHTRPQERARCLSPPSYRHWRWP